MSSNPKHWVKQSGDGSLKPADVAAPKPGPDEVLLEVDSCSLWNAGVGFQFGGTHGGGNAAAVQHRISGHVVEAGDNALFFADRPVALAGVVPCGRHAECFGGGAVTCPNRTAEGPGACVLASARDVALAEKHPAHPIGPGLVPFDDG